MGLHLVGCQASSGWDVSTDTFPRNDHADHSDATAAFWVANMKGGEVVAFSRDGARVGTVVDEESLPDRLRPFTPSSIVPDGDRILVTQYSTGELLSFDKQGQFEGIFFENSSKASAPRMEEPCMIRIVDGEAWVLGNDTRNILIFDDEGEVLEEVGRAPMYLRNPHGFDVTDDGFLYVALSPSHPGRGLIQIWDMTLGRPVGEFAAYGEIEEGTGLTVMPDRTMLVSDWFGNQVLRYDQHTGEVIDWLADSSDGLEQPVSTAVGHDGTVYILDSGGVMRMDDDGLVRIVDGEAEGLHWARGILAVNP